MQLVTGSNPTSAVHQFPVRTPVRDKGPGPSVVIGFLTTLPGFPGPVTHLMPRKKNGFRVCRKAFALTWSCPVAATNNPITSRDSIVTMLQKHGECDYLVSTELHQNGKTHYHGYVKYHQEKDISNSRFFDVSGVHPDIDKKAPGKGWLPYIKKKGDFTTNIEGDPWSTAMSLATPEAATEHLWKNKPRDMAMHAHNIERNIHKRMRSAPEMTTYYGPFPQSYYPRDDFNPSTHSLLLYGPPGLGKTQFARYYAAHCFGPTQYFRKHQEELRHLDPGFSFIFDECGKFASLAGDESREVTDVENGGTLDARFNPIKLPPVKRIFIANTNDPFKDDCPDGIPVVYGRRVYSHAVC